MKNFNREYTAFALCGLNCGLCPMYHMEKPCPGCGGGEGNQSCAIARCSLEHGGPAHCSQCGEFPCARYEGLTGYDSFLSHRNMLRDLKRAEEMGYSAYRAELEEKMEILRKLLLQYNDGRRKTFFCTAVNLLELEDARAVMEQIEAGNGPEQGLKERVAAAADCFLKMADSRGISLKLRKKPKKA